MTINIGIADDHALVRAGFRVLIDSAADLAVRGEAATGREAIELARSQSIDVMLMDIRMPEMDGIKGDASNLLGSSAVLDPSAGANDV
jgi:YesN/AraC family two-component response regulator